MIPDWVCAVLSPGTAKKDRFTKMEIDRESLEVRHVWLADPLHKTLEEFGRGEPGAWVPERFFAGDDIVRAEPFPAAEFPLKGLWLE